MGEGVDGKKHRYVHLWKLHDSLGSVCVSERECKVLCVRVRARACSKVTDEVTP